MKCDVFALCYEVVQYGFRDWYARVRARAFLVVFPKRGVSDVGSTYSERELAEKYEIESCLFTGNLDRVRALLESADVSKREKYILGMTAEFLRGNYGEVVRLAGAPEYAAVEPKSERVEVLLLNAYFALSRYGDLDHVLDLVDQKENAYLQVNLALICRELGRRGRAYEHARRAHALDPDCPLIVAVYTRLSYENADVQQRHNRLDEWLKAIYQAKRHFADYYEPYLKQEGAKRWCGGQAWKVALFLLTTEAHFLVRKGDPGSLELAFQLLRMGFEIAPQDPWLRFETALYLRVSRDRISRKGFAALRVAILEFKALWQLRSIERGLGYRGMTVPTLEANGLSIRWYLTNDVIHTPLEVKS
jgi:hypothetical protein